MWLANFTWYYIYVYIVHVTVRSFLVQKQSMFIFFPFHICKVCYHMTRPQFIYTFYFWWIFQFTSITNEVIQVHTSVVYGSRSGIAVPWKMFRFSRWCRTVLHSGGIHLNFPKVYSHCCCSISSPAFDLVSCFFFLILWCISLPFLFEFPWLLMWLSTFSYV